MKHFILPCIYFIKAITKIQESKEKMKNYYQDLIFKILL